MICQAQLKLESGGYAICNRDVKAHAQLAHKEFSTGTEWPACSQLCLLDHAHGRYRMKLGQKAGPSTAAARGPKRGKPAKQPAEPACSVCLTVAELEGGKCKDQAACADRAPALFDLGGST